MIHSSEISSSCYQANWCTTLPTLLITPSIFNHALGLFLFKPSLFCWFTTIKRSTSRLSLTFFGDIQIELKHWQLIFPLFSAWHIQYHSRTFLCRNKMKWWKKMYFFKDQNQWRHILLSERIIKKKRLRHTVAL